MAAHPRLMIGAGIAIAGLGLIGGGAGATFTAQVSTHSKITSGGLGFSLNGETGSDVKVNLNGENIGSHFAPIETKLLLKNTGTLDMASHFLDLTATGCEGGDGKELAKALDITLTDVTNLTDTGDGTVVYDGELCLFGSSMKDAGFVVPPQHTGVGRQLRRPLDAGDSINYRLVIRPHDSKHGLPSVAQQTTTSVSLVFSGFDY